MKTIIPIKLIVEINEDGTFKHGLLQYKLKENDVLGNKFHTMTVNAGITLSDIEKILTDSKAHVVKGEKIEEANLAEEKLKSDLAELAKLKAEKQGEKI